MWLAYSLALPNKPNFWAVSAIVNIWLFALKLFVYNNVINILNRAKVWPWDSGILTNFIIYRSLPLFLVLLFMVLVIPGQPQSENIKEKFQK